MKCSECNVVGFSLEELLPDGLCKQCRLASFEAKLGIKELIDN